MTPETAIDKELGGQNANFQGYYLLRSSPNFKKGVMNDPQKPLEIQNWGSFVQNVRL